MKIPCNMLIIQPIIENIHKLLFRKIRRFFFAMFPYRPVYATHEWLFVILDSLDSRVLDINALPSDIAEGIMQKYKEKYVDPYEDLT